MEEDYVGIELGEDRDGDGDEDDAGDGDEEFGDIQQILDDLLGGGVNTNQRYL